MAQKFLLVLLFPLFISACKNSTTEGLQKQILDRIGRQTLEKAGLLLHEEPITVTSFQCRRSAGGLHDFYSEGDYWWPDPNDPEGPYIRRDGQSNPGNFSEHRHAMVRMNEIVSTLTSAWLITGKQEYADNALAHLNAWFVDTATMMNPNMLYAQAIYGRVTGRGIGLIDAYHLVEVCQSVKILSERAAIPRGQSIKIKEWFSRFLGWMLAHQYGTDEMNTKNNHATCWVATAASMARLTGNRDVTQMCIDRFKDVLLPGQMETDGSFPLELERTKPYGYSLFNIDAMCNVAEILSCPEDNLWEFTTADGKSLAKGMEFIFPFIADKKSWPYKQDVYIWDLWPARQSSLLFAGLAYNKPEYIAQYLKLPANPTNKEVIRNLPVRHPAIWLYGQSKGDGNKYVNIPFRFLPNFKLQKDSSNNHTLINGEGLAEIEVPTNEVAIVMVDTWNTFDNDNNPEVVNCIKNTRGLLCKCRENGVTVIHAPNHPVVDKYPQYHAIKKEVDDYIGHNLGKRAAPAAAFLEWPAENAYNKIIKGKREEGRSAAYSINPKGKRDISALLTPLAGEYVLSTYDQFRYVLWKEKIKVILYVGGALNECMLQRDTGINLLAGSDNKTANFGIVVVEDCVFIMDNPFSGYEESKQEMLNYYKRKIAVVSNSRDMVFR